MGYFSNAEIWIDRDYSYVTPEQQLQWRLEDLQERCRELRAAGAIYGNASYTQDDLRYALPEQFCSVWEVEAAMELAVSDLEKKYGICVSQVSDEEEPGIDEITEMQISFLDILSLHPLAA